MASAIVKRWSPRRWSSTHNLIKFALVEAGQFRGLPIRVFSVNLDQAGNKEFLFLVGLRIPEIRLLDSDDEARLASCLSQAGVYRWAREGLDVG